MTHEDDKPKIRPINYQLGRIATGIRTILSTQELDDLTPEIREALERLRKKHDPPKTV